MRTYLLVLGTIRYDQIVQEIVLFGSKFTPRGGYFTPEGINIPRALREEVIALKQQFNELAQEQRSQTRVVPIVPRTIRDITD